MSTADHRRTAVIGMAVRLPGADSPEAFWDNNEAGRVFVRRFAPAELVAAGYPESYARDPEVIGASALVDDIDLFDAACFGMSPRDAAITDPQHRLFLEVSQHALEDAGYCGPGVRVATFGAVGYHLQPLGGYLRTQLDGRVFDDGFEHHHASALQVAFGNGTDFIATQTAFRLGLTGPAMTVQTGCSSGLVALDQAVRALWHGDADIALVAAAALHIPQVFANRHVKGSILSRTGVCRAFDAASDGTVSGNGVVALVVKRLDHALRDGDRIYASILGVGLSNDGASKQTYAAPSASGQAEAIAQAFDRSGVSPADIGYLETHGTGTFKGDPIEFAAADRTWREREWTPGGCALGAVKPSIGHLDAAAGLAGLVKAIGVVRRGVIPPLPNFTAPNPTLPLDGGPFHLPAEPEPWPDLGAPRRAGVTALGVGGTNAHVIIEQPPSPVPPPRRDSRRAPGVVPLSAATPETLRDLAKRWGEYLRDNPDVDLRDVITTAALGRRRMRHRLAALGDNTAQLSQALLQYADTGSSPHCLSGIVDPRAATRDDERPELGRRDEAELPSADVRLARRHCDSDSVDWDRVLADCGGRRISLPGYPYRRARHWIGPPARPTTIHSEPSTAQGDSAMTTPERVLDHIQRVVAAQLGCDVATVGADVPFTALGADSLSMVNLANDLEKHLSVRVSMRELFEVADTPVKLAKLIAERIAETPAAAVSAAPVTTSDAPTPAPAATSETSSATSETTAASKTSVATSETTAEVSETAAAGLGITAAGSSDPADSVSAAAPTTAANASAPAGATTSPGGVAGATPTTGVGHEATGTAAAATTAAASVPPGWPVASAAPGQPTMPGQPGQTVSPGLSGPAVAAGWGSTPETAYQAASTVEWQLAVTARAVENLAVQLGHLAHAQTQLMQQFSQLIAQQAAQQQALWEAVQRAQGGR